MPVPSSGPTGAFDVSRDGPTASIIPNGGVAKCGFGEERRRLLRRRLILIQSRMRLHCNPRMARVYTSNH
jgi:hypothetical protein